MPTPKKTRFEPLSRESFMVCSILNAGLHNGHGAASIHASSKGLRIALNGVTIARGKTPEELEQNYEARRRQALRDLINTGA